MSVELGNFVSLGRKILGAGINYKSMVQARNVSVPKEPIIFLKPTSSYIQEGQAIQIPKDFDVYEEVELGVIIGKKAKNVKVSEARDFVGGYCLAFDLTAVNDMKHARENGLPWTFGKGFDTACPVSKFIPCHAVKDICSLCISCSINGQLIQENTLSDMIFSIDELIAYTSQYITLEPYDLILTGTPSGNGPIKEGDIVEGRLDNLIHMKFPVVSMC